MRIFCWGTYDTGKPRTRLLLDGLRANGAVVTECHADIWKGVADKSQLHGTGRKLGILLRWLGSYPRLTWRLMRTPAPDVVLVGFPGILDMIVAAPIARMRGIPLAWDMFMSLYDTVVEDRRLLRRGGFLAGVLRALEGFALRRADFVFLDTQAHARRIEKLFAVPDGAIGAVWVGVETEYFHPDPTESEYARPAIAEERSPLRVLFYGQFIPLHGIETIVQAARLTRDEPIEWQLIGRGQEAPRIKEMLDTQPLPNIHWDEWVDYAQLPLRIASADVCLGIFGSSQKAASVIPNKVFQIVAMRRPVVTRDSPAIREMLDDASPCTYLVPPDDPAALASALRDISRREQQPHPCHANLQDKIDAKAVGRQCINFLTQHPGLES